MFFAQWTSVMILRTLALAVLIGLAAPAFAQPAAPAPLAPHGCVKPDDYPGRLASDMRRNNWVKSANAYLDCLKKFIQEQQGAYNKVLEQGKPHLDAANASIDEYNKAAAQFKADQEGGK
jgi:hypothetical protein